MVLRDVLLRGVSPGLREAIASLPSGSPEKVAAQSRLAILDGMLASYDGQIARHAWDPSIGPAPLSIGFSNDFVPALPSKEDGSTWIEWELDAIHQEEQIRLDEGARLEVSFLDRVRQSQDHTNVGSHRADMPQVGPSMTHWTGTHVS